MSNNKIKQKTSEVDLVTRVGNAIAGLVTGDLKIENSNVEEMSFEDEDDNVTRTYNVANEDLVINPVEIGNLISGVFAGTMNREDEANSEETEYSPGGSGRDSKPTSNGSDNSGESRFSPGRTTEYSAGGSGSDATKETEYSPGSSGRDSNFTSNGSQNSGESRFSPGRTTEYSAGGSVRDL